MAADKEDQVAAFAFGRGDECRKAGGGDGLARRVEQDFAGGGVPGPNINAFGPNLAHLRGGVAADTFQELGGQGVGVRVLWPANKIKIQFHTGALCGRDFQRLGAAPEAFQAVILAGFGGKDVNQKVAVVGQHPFRLAVAFHAGRQFTGLLFELDSDFFADGLDLPLIGSGADHKEISEGGDSGEIEYFDVGRLFGFGGANGDQPCGR